MTSDLQIILAELRNLKAHGPAVPSAGICLFMSTRVSGSTYWYWKDHFNAAVKAWPEFSGNIEFPVPGGHRSAAEAYYYYFHLWDRRGAYGKARWLLVDHLIAYFEALEK